MTKQKISQVHSHSNPAPDPYPLVEDIYKVVPLPFTQMVLVQSRQNSAPNSLCMICWGGTAAPLFPKPSTSLQSQVTPKLKQNILSPLYKPPSIGTKSGTTTMTQHSNQLLACHPAEAFFCLAFKYPRSKAHIATPNLQKQKAVSRKC
ncbi:hypothetical protein PTTG_25244 [Puccinia triticina 1-1 BBBD Race 1]|uniref:Uncharacterized protein n=1 Tax=Puccinia triticina (isolate 1-1 / race 1 (BBBD)) TaxID=630390 RepID=A0A180H4Q1_PUCT1|nr:hypothetical protein PTTG_25244 [Puccinia triticina 1-1 BBBD Race 1]